MPRFIRTTAFYYYYYYYYCLIGQGRLGAFCVLFKNSFQRHDGSSAVYAPQV